MARFGLLEVLSHQEVLRIHESSLRILEEVGVKAPWRPLLELLREAGARVDFAQERVRFPAQLLEGLIARAPASYTLHARDPKHDMPWGLGRTSFAIAATVVDVVDLDGRWRPATFQDAKDYCRLGDALPNVSDGYCAVHPTDVPDQATHTYAMLAQFTCSTKPARGRINGTSRARDCLQMAEIVAGGAKRLSEKPSIMAVMCPVSPLTNAADQVQGMMEYAARGMPLVIAPETAAGATGPVTLAGVLAQANAEVLAMVAAVQAINPGTPVAYGTVCSNLDLKKGMHLYSSAESCLLNVAAAQMARHYRLPCRGTGGYPDANSMDFQAGFETMMTLMCAALAGQDYVLGSAGALANGTAINPEKLVADDELIGIVKRMARGIEVAPETLALEQIQEVGIAGNFLGLMHTFQRFRSEHFLPELSIRERYDVWENAGRPSMQARAREKAERLLAEHEVPPLPAEVEGELWAIVRRAEGRDASKGE